MGFREQLVFAVDGVLAASAKLHALKITGQGLVSFDQVGVIAVHAPNQGRGGRRHNENCPIVAYDHSPYYSSYLQIT